MSKQQTNKTMRERQWENVLNGKSNSHSAGTFDFRDTFDKLEKRIQIIEEKFPNVNVPIA